MKWIRRMSSLYKCEAAAQRTLLGSGFAFMQGTQLLILLLKIINPISIGVVARVCFVLTSLQHHGANR
ncbi:hypothetical protein SAMN05216167_10693 [Spirosoma endophyticum]|uniref:Uncharacterized protein n=1 Tax=Spirosoma endophyticum TaxID=662367 RepID=A0A1I1U1Z2_9BACT|nr:hypothetical protein SAMN05216167_10693 [Spirosoma endophyticum]